MALDKLVNSAQLDSDLGDVADAIRAKSGGSGSLAFPAGFVSEIGSIQTGGGGGLTLLADYTADEDVSAIQIDFTPEMQAYNQLTIKLEGSFNRQEYPCPAFNEEPNTRAYLAVFPSNTNRVAYVHLAPLRNANGGISYYPFYGATRDLPAVSMPISYFKVACYYADGLFKAGFNIKVYRVVVP